MMIKLAAFIMVLAMTMQIFAVSGITAVRKSPQYKEALAKGAEANLSVRVRDELGEAVSNANVHIEYDMTTYSVNVDGRTDSQGICLLCGKTRGNAVTVFVTKEGYYPSSKRLCLASMTDPHAVVNGKWQPDPMAVPLELRRIHSHPDVVNFGEILPVPVTNQWFGFDLRSGCFSTKNDSACRADVEFYVEWDGKPPMTSRFCKLKMRFPECGSGGYYSSLISESAFPFAYRAMENADFKVTMLEIVDRDGSPHTTKIPFREGSELIARIRCEFDEKNKLVSANYCSIKAVRVSPSWDSLPTLRFVYSFNPIVNDTNLEAKRR